MDNQLKLKIGDVLELGDLIGGQYKQTRQYDLNIEVNTQQIIREQIGSFLQTKPICSPKEKY